MIESSDSVEALAETWDDLADRCGADPFTRPGWIGAWWDAFGDGRLELLTLRRDGRLAALVPIQHVRGELHSPTNWHTPSFDLLAEDEDAAAELARAVFARKRRAVRLAFLLPGSTGLECSREAAAGYRLLERPLEQAPYVDTSGSWDAYVEALGAKVVAELRRRRRRLEETGELTFEVADGTERLDALLDEGFAVEAAGWKGQDGTGTAIGVGDRTKRFYPAIARWAADRGWLRLAFVRLDGRALGFDFAIETGGVHSLLKTGYDESYRKLGPGKLLRFEMLRRAFEDGIDTYDFLGDFEPWKREWAQTAKPRLLLQAFRQTPAGLAEWFAFAHLRPLVKRLLRR
jgi:CelD/BcsL family acetyltransferase involved in cellulose biosynthesis